MSVAAARIPLGAAAALTALAVLSACSAGESADETVPGTPVTAAQSGDEVGEEHEDPHGDTRAMVTEALAGERSVSCEFVTAGEVGRITVASDAHWRADTTDPQFGPSSFLADGDTAYLWFDGDTDSVAFDRHLADRSALYPDLDELVVKADRLDCTEPMDDGALEVPGEVAFTPAADDGDLLLWMVDQSQLPDPARFFEMAAADMSETERGDLAALAETLTGFAPEDRRAAVAQLFE